MQLIEFIFSNPLFIIIILGLINFLIRQGKSDDQKNSPKKVERKPVNERVPEMKHEQHVDKKLSDIKREQTVEHAEVEEPLTVEELRQEQLERFSTELQGTVNRKAENKNYEQTERVKRPQHVESKSDEKHKVKKGLKGRLTRKGLIESVVMAEVLGPPRAMKRYQSGYMHRRY